MTTPATMGKTGGVIGRCGNSKTYSGETPSVVLVSIGQSLVQQVINTIHRRPNMHPTTATYS